MWLKAEQLGRPHVEYYFERYYPRTPFSFRNRPYHYSNCHYEYNLYHGILTFVTFGERRWDERTYKFTEVSRDEIETLIAVKTLGGLIRGV